MEVPFWSKRSKHFAALHHGKGVSTMHNDTLRDRIKEKATIYKLETQNIVC